MDVAKDIKSLLTYITTSIYLHDLPENPDNVIVISYSKKQLDPTYTLSTKAFDNILIDINVRHTDPNTAFYWIKSIEDTINLLSPRKINSNYYIGIMQLANNEKPGKDSKNRFNITNSYKVMVSRNRYYVLGYSLDEASALTSLQTNYRYIDILAPQTYVTDGLGTITGSSPTEQLTEANTRGIDSYLTVVNSGFDSDIVKTLLESETNRASFISNLLNLLSVNGYNGVNIDFEGVYTENRDDFSTFISELSSSMNDYKLSLSSPALTTDTGFFDYETLEPLVDNFVIMSYDYSYASAGPIAPIEWVKNTIDYTITKVPVNKILVGLAAYGYRWGSDDSFNSFTIQGIYDLISDQSVTPLWDDTYKEYYFTYTDGGVDYTVYYEDQAAWQYKMDYVIEKRLKGIGIWRLGTARSDEWSSIITKLK